MTLDELVAVTCNK